MVDVLVLLWSALTSLFRSRGRLEAEILVLRQQISVLRRARQLGSGDFAIQVQDSGPGMTGEEIAIAFERFGQVDAGPERRHEGTGLGLPLARSLVELHGGALEIHSEKGRGTTATITLPAQRIIPVSSAVEALQNVTVLA